MKNLFLLTSIIILLGCSSSGVVKLENDLYLLAKKSPQVGFGPSVTLKGDVYREANEFCEKSARKLETVSFESTDAGFAKSPTASLQFKCVLKSDENK